MFKKLFKALFVEFDLGLKKASRPANSVDFVNTKNSKNTIVVPLIDFKPNRVKFIGFESKSILKFMNSDELFVSSDGYFKIVIFKKNNFMLR